LLKRIKITYLKNELSKLTNNIKSNINYFIILFFNQISIMESNIKWCIS